MTTKLVQKHFLKGLREFEILDDSVNVRIKTPFKEETLSVVLSVLNPEPVINRSYLEFHSRVKCGPLLSLYLNKPSPEEFNVFVDTLKQRALEEYGAFAGINVATQSAGLAENVHDKPPEFDDSCKIPTTNIAQNIDVTKLDNAIKMLGSYLDSEDIKPLVSALEALKADPLNESRLADVLSAFNGLGPAQGAVLTYAPYVSVLLSDDPFGNP